MTSNKKNNSKNFICKTSTNQNKTSFNFYPNKQFNNLNKNLNDSENKNNNTESNQRSSYGGVSSQNHSSTNLAWLNILKRSNADLNTKQDMENVITEKSDFMGVNASQIQNENSVFSDNSNFEDFEKILTEENLSNLINENSFSNSESQSTLPFFLLSSREIHRMCISDYEIKLICKKFRYKQKIKRLDWIDFYKKGLIKVFQAKYFEAYNYFKEAESFKKEEIEVKKWICFVQILIIFCVDFRKSKENFRSLNELDEKNEKLNLDNNNNNNQEGRSYGDSKSSSNTNTNNNYFDSKFYASFFMSLSKINFESIRSLEIKNEEIYFSGITDKTDSDEEIDRDSNAAFFGCCNSRKPSSKARHKKSKESDSIDE